MSHAASAHTDPRADINTTPLVDVMLVLLIIFMITAPLLTHELPFKLPVPGPVSEIEVPTRIALRLAEGQLSYQLDGVALDLESLRSNFRRDGQLAPKDQPLFELIADDAVPYAKVAELMALAQSAGVRTMGLGELQSR